ncbi:putative membrane protein [Fusarium bulbicola]|nr:putative membrane protein [Fusarium bulbicola]
MKAYGLFLVSLAAIAAAADVTLTSSGCADASGFEKCQASANKKTSSCIAQARHDNSQVELLACGCQDYVDNFNCYAAFCWNRFWECEYQEYMVSYFMNCNIAKQPVPYFPAPKNAQGACSCNVGQVYLNIQDAIQQTGTCSNSANSGDAGSNLQKIEGCNCCEISRALSSIVEICPKTDPNLIGLKQLSTLESELNVDYKSCGSYMETYDCSSQLSYSLEGVSTYYKPDDPLKTGTATLSNNPGSVTAPASGKVFLYTNGGDGTAYTITAAGVGKGSSGSKGSSESDGSSDASGDSTGSTGTSTGDSSKATESSKKNGADKLATGRVLIMGATLLLTLAAIY